MMKDEFLVHAVTKLISQFALWFSKLIFKKKIIAKQIYFIYTMMIETHRKFAFHVKHVFFLNRTENKAEKNELGNLDIRSVFHRIPFLEGLMKKLFRK